MLLTSSIWLALASVAAASPLVAVDAHSLFARTSCSTTGVASCQNTTAQSNLCCFESPGGQLVQTQVSCLLNLLWTTDLFMNTLFSFGTSILVRGLPTAGQFMDSGPTIATEPTTRIAILPALTQISRPDILSYMQTYWRDINGKDETFWEHEWAKHGTCMSTLKPACISSSVRGQDAIYYFTRVVNLFKTLTTYEFLGAAGIYPSSTATYTLAQINAAVKAKWGYTPAFDCTSGSLNAASYYYHLKGSIIDGTLVPIDAPKAGSCGSTGIKYPPKSGSSVSTTGAGTGTTTSAASTGTAVPTKATIAAVTSSGTQTGCLLTAGTWSVQTCATYTLTTVSDGFTLTTSKGLCQVSGGSLTCGSSVTSGSVFTSSGGLLTYGGSTAFTGDSTPSGTTQITIYAGSSHAQDITLKIVST
ncbi:Ribonuclease T2 [Ceratobasidium theobromae]|uniref:ribonuclease T2 n=1 Tax=Ceratobasidium theobromae TaxID=1582974 RepID=A0A5N5QMK1_9AGAM|nr:Ribonuclease T2 [Ceratobasidium theobromae]